MDEQPPSARAGRTFSTRGSGSGGDTAPAVCCARGTPPAAPGGPHVAPGRPDRPNVPDPATARDLGQVRAHLHRLIDQFTHEALGALYRLVGL
jgi:hypothetical protein